MTIHVPPSQAGTVAPPFKSDVPRVGPNAIIQMQAAITEVFGHQETAQFFCQHDIHDLWQLSDSAMVPQNDALRLHLTVSRSFASEQAEAFARRAGDLTGQYILANRIPRAVKILLKHLPSSVAGTLLLKAITKHAWTFAGSGRVYAETHQGWRIVIEGNPLAMAPCHWHMAVFTRLFRELVSPNIVVHETTCCGKGAQACTIVISRLS